MSNLDALFDERGRLKPVKSMSTWKRAKDWWIKGFQLNRCYIKHWDEITDVFENYNIDMNRQGPIITLQALKQVRMAKDLTDKLKNNPEIRKAAEKCPFPLRTVYYSNMNKDKQIEGTIFIILLRLIPEFCLEYGMKNLNDFVKNGNSEGFLKRAFSTEGTIIDTEDDFERIVKDMVKKLAKP